MRTTRIERQVRVYRGRVITVWFSKILRSTTGLFPRADVVYLAEPALFANLPAIRVFYENEFKHWVAISPSSYPGMEFHGRNPRKAFVRAAAFLWEGKDVTATR